MRFAEAVAAADRALALAAELGLAAPARALGFRGSARAAEGEREGVEEMRRALDLAVEQGKGREAAVLYNNLSIDSGSTRARRLRSPSAVTGSISAVDAASLSSRSRSPAPA